MGAHSQSGRPMALSAPLLEPDALLLARLEGSEGLSQLFQFRLEVLAESPVPFPKVLGQAVTVRLDAPGCPRRHINGILRSLTQGGQVTGTHGQATFIRYRAELVPRLWLLSRRTQSRIFQRSTVPEILTSVFREWKLDVRLTGLGTYPRRDYCVQYQESDLAFVSRLMEDEGIWYHFEHTEHGHTLVLGDVPDAHADLPGGKELRYDDGQGGLRAPLRVTGWEKTQEVCSCTYDLRDYCFEMPEKDLQASEPIHDAVRIGSVDHHLGRVAGANASLLEVHDYPGGYGRRFDSVSPGGGQQGGGKLGELLFQENKRVAGLRMQEEAARAASLAGTSVCGHLRPGCRFELQGHFDGNGPYVLTGVRHNADLEASYLGTAEDGFVYANSFSALPQGLPFRPTRNTPRPTIPGTQTATVVGPGDSDLFVDNHGRIKVKFHWDRRAGGGPESSCWLRVGQVWAGKRWGAFFWPRVGHEVIVAFEDGDPDRPIVVGSVYNGTNATPFVLPEHSNLAGIKSYTTSGSKEKPCDPLLNFNGIVFDDKVGEEHLEVHGERHITFSAEESHLHNVNGPHRVNVATNHTLHVGSLPVPGSGSGGEGDHMGENPTGYQLDPHGKRAFNLSTVWGLNSSVVTGINSALAVGAQWSLNINPGALTELFGLSPNPALAGVMGALSPLLGKNDMVVGSHVMLNYGNKLIALRGARPIVNHVKNIRSKEGIGPSIVAKVLALTALGETIAHGYHPNEVSQRAWEGLLGTIGGLAGLLAMADSAYAYADHAMGLETAASAAAAGRNPAILTRLATLAGSMLSDNGKESDLSTCNYVGGTKAEFAKTIVQGASEALMLYAGSEANEQSVLTMEKDRIVLTLGDPVAGPRLELVAGLEPGIKLSVGVTTVLDMKPGKILLAVVPDLNQFEVDNQGINEQGIMIKRKAEAKEKSASLESESDADAGIILI